MFCFVFFKQKSLFLKYIVKIIYTIWPTVCGLWTPDHSHPYLLFERPIPELVQCPLVLDYPVDFGACLWKLLPFSIREVSSC